MAPFREILVGFNTKSNIVQKPSKLSMENLQRTISDISLELSKEANEAKILPPISEVEDAKCECCGMCEECTPEYINRVRDKFSGKLICGLCAEAVKEEMEKNGGKREEALSEHMSECVKFSRFGRTYPVLYQAEAMRELLKKSTRLNGGRAKSVSPRDRGGPNKGGIARSSSCIPAITREIKDLKMLTE
ncbi:uncharacterized protein LOC132302292 [Cornus florida]|uniref:uncharacterized protein LOC132302292 n=1 Tax=Cornus florida TaxID=4283 RepID=UPI0028A1F0BB|nr:uncharacterized protein LOC132302292 [Cornus florida]